MVKACESQRIQKLALQMYIYLESTLKDESNSVGFNVSISENQKVDFSGFWVQAIGETLLGKNLGWDPCTFVPCLWFAEEIQEFLENRIHLWVRIQQLLGTFA